MTTTNSETVGRPVGNVKIGRRFTAHEIVAVAAGLLADVVSAAGRPMTREEAYNTLFAAEEA